MWFKEKAMQFKRKHDASEEIPEHQIILLAAAAAMFAWVMNAVLDFYFYTEKTFEQTLFLDLTARELYSRVAIASAFLVSGIIISRTVESLKVTRARAHRLDKCVRSVRAVNQLITREQDRSSLCQRASDQLVSGLGYRQVEVLLGGVVRGNSELPPACRRRNDPPPREPISIPMTCCGDQVGELRVTLGQERTWDGEEKALLKEVAEDIAFAVRGIGVSESLRHQREEVQTVLDSVSAYISYKDTEGRYLRVNKALAELAGVPQSEWEGRTLDEIVPGATACCGCADREVMESGKRRHTILESIELPNATRWVQTDRVPYMDSDGEIIGVITLSVDMTDRLEAERALSCKEEELRQSQKIEAIGQLAGGIAHDFNNLLTAISGYTELACNQLGEEHPVYDMLSAVSKSSDRAASLTGQLLAFSRKQPLCLAEQNLNEVVEGMLEMLERLIGEDVELVTELGPDIGKVEADASQIEQVVMNLAVNARDAMPEGGRLTIGTSVVDADAEECVPCTGHLKGECVVLTVSDTGTGMDANTMNQIFEPFFTTKRPGVGTGLGLSVVYGIVEQHGGWIAPESHLGQGTAFRICLPMVVDKPCDCEDSNESESIPPSAPAGSGERVLLVEDEDAVRAFACRALRDWGYDIVEATTAEEALELLADDDAGFDLLFSDIVLPGKSGTQLAQEVAEHIRDSRVLLASGYLFPEGRDCATTAADVGFPLLTKPYSVSGLRAAIHTALS